MDSKGPDFLVLKMVNSTLQLVTGIDSLITSGSKVSSEHW